MTIFSVSRSRIALILATCFYTATFVFTYRDLVAPLFGFWGFGYRSIPSTYLWVSVVLSVLPSFWMPIQFTRPSLLLFYVQYLLIFIPASFLVYYSIRPELQLNEGMMLVVVMFLALCIIQCSYLLTPVRIRAARVSPELFWSAFCGLAVMMFLYLAIALGSLFQIVSLSDVYNLRTAMSEALRSTGSSFGFYAQSLLSALVLPLAFAIAMWYRRRWTLIPIAIGYLFLFGIGGAKATVLALVYAPLLYLVITQRRASVPVMLLGGLSILLAVGYATKLILPPRMHLYYVALFHFRFLAVPPLTIPQYYAFFQTHPVTHLSHVTGINRLVQYPFDLDIPYTIGTFYYGLQVGANSGFWAGDGLAGFGLWGIPLLSLLCAAIFWILDSASADFDPRFIGAALFFCTVFFGNASIFTTLVTGGLGLFICAILVAPRNTEGLIRLPTLSQLRTAA